MESKRERGSGRLFQRGQIWWAQYYSHGRQIRVSTEETDEKRAGKFLKRKLAEVETGTHIDARNIRYEDLRDAYMVDYQVNHRKSLHHDAKGEPYLDAVKRLDDFFYGFKASQVDADGVRQFQADQQKKGLSNGSINRSVSALRRMFNLALEDGRLNAVPYFPMLKESAPRSGFFEREQYDKLFAALPDYLRLPLALGYYTGMRLSEVRNLRWEQVDFLHGMITLRAGETKNDQGRVIPIVPQLAGLLAAQHARRQEGCPYVCFRVHHLGRALQIGGFRKAWQARCIKLGLGRMESAADASGEVAYEKARGDRRGAKSKVKMIYRGMLYHDLRRSTVRNLVRAGVPEKVAMKVSGHLSRSVFDRYNISSERDVLDAGQKLATFLEKDGDKTGTAVHQVAASSSVLQ